MSYPRFAQFPKVKAEISKVQATNLATMTPLGLEEIFTTGPDGGILVKAGATPMGTTTPCSVLLYGSTDNGATKMLLASTLVPAYENGPSILRPVTPFAGVSIDEPIQLEANMIVYFGTELAVVNGIQCTCQYQEFAPYQEPINV